MKMDLLCLKIKSYFVILVAILFTTEALCSKKSNTQPKNNKLDACFISINSKDEEKVFRKYLPSNDFNFHSFITPALEKKGMGDEWFAEACKKDISCDLLLVSGHFGGIFFSEKSRLTLSINTLESASCKNRCPGFLKSPKEVFLFGCNTLASKERDSRSDEQYLNVLLAERSPDGSPVFTPDQARAVVEARYGMTGLTNKDRIVNSFSNTPAIYGYKSVGPLGKEAKASLENYFKKVGNYADHLLQLETKRVIDQIKKNGDFDNLILKSSLKQFNYEDCPGVNFTGQNKLGLKSLVCQLSSRAHTLEQKLEIFESAMKSPYLYDLLSNLNDYSNEFLSYFDQPPVDKWVGEVFGRLQKNKELKNKLMSLILSPHAAIESKGDALMLLGKLGMLTKQEQMLRVKAMYENEWKLYLAHPQNNRIQNIDLIRFISNQLVEVPPVGGDNAIDEFTWGASMGVNLGLTRDQIKQGIEGSFPIPPLVNSNTKNYLDVLEILDCKNEKEDSSKRNAALNYLRTWMPSPPLDKAQLNRIAQKRDQCFAKILKQNANGDNLSYSGSEPGATFALMKLSSPDLSQYPLTRKIFENYIEKCDSFIMESGSSGFFSAEEIQNILGTCKGEMLKYFTQGILTKLPNTSLERKKITLLIAKKYALGGTGFRIPRDSFEVEDLADTEMAEGIFGLFLGADSKPSRRTYPLLRRGLLSPDQKVVGLVKNIISKYDLNDPLFTEILHLSTDAERRQMLIKDNLKSIFYFEKKSSNRQ